MSSIFTYVQLRTFELLLCQIVIRMLLNDILNASLPGDYGKADKKAMRIREKLSFFERMTQRYIGQYVIEKYRTDYHFYAFLKFALVVCYLLGILVFVVLTLIGKVQEAAKFQKIALLIDVVIMIFLGTRYDINRNSKYTRNK